MLAAFCGVVIELERSPNDKNLEPEETDDRPGAKQEEAEADAESQRAEGCHHKSKAAWRQRPVRPDGQAFPESVAVAFGHERSILREDNL